MLFLSVFRFLGQFIGVQIRALFEILSFSFFVSRTSRYHFSFQEFFLSKRRGSEFLELTIHRFFFKNPQLWFNWSWYMTSLSKCWKISYVNWAVLYWVCFEDLNFIPIYLFLVKIGFLTDVTFVTCLAKIQIFTRVPIFWRNPTVSRFHMIFDV